MVKSHENVKLRATERAGASRTCDKHAWRSDVQKWLLRDFWAMGQSSDNVLGEVNRNW